MLELSRVTQDARVMGGKPCMRGLRVTVGMLVEQIALGIRVDENLVAYPYLERDDIGQALLYAAC